MEYHESNPWNERVNALVEELDHHERAASQILTQLANARTHADLWEARSESHTDTEPGEWFPPPGSGW